MSRETDHLLAVAQHGVPEAKVSPRGFWRPDSKAWHGQRGTPNAQGDDRSLALDLVGPRPSRDSEVLRRIFDTLWPHRFSLRELYYAGPGVQFNVYRGRVTELLLVPKSIRDDHHDHVHVAAIKGKFVPLPTPRTAKEARAMNPEIVADCIPRPPVPRNPKFGPVGFYATDAKGNVFNYVHDDWAVKGLTPEQQRNLQYPITGIHAGFGLLYDEPEAFAVVLTAAGGTGKPGDGGTFVLRPKT